MLGDLFGAGSGPPAAVLRSRQQRAKPAELRAWLFLGGTSTAEDKETMQQIGITHILNVAGQ